MKAKLYLTLYCIAMLVCLMGRIVDAPLSQTLDYASKPLLMPLLFLYLNEHIKFDAPLLSFVTTGLLFAWGGDLLLMIAGSNLGLFIAGLLSFLMMQLLYIRYYARASQQKQNIFKTKPYLALPSCIIAAVFYAMLYPKLGPILKIAVAIYALALLAMTLGAINRLGQTNSSSFALVTLGAFSFMFSDMMIGYHKFLQEFTLAGFWIMLTYALGQLLIIQGLILHQKTKS